MGKCDVCGRKDVTTWPRFVGLRLMLVCEKCHLEMKKNKAQIKYYEEKQRKLKG
jgi:hypothetical protein